MRLLSKVVWATSALLGQLFFGCSLTSIPFVRVGECESDVSCNEALGAKCAQYECVATTDKKGESFTQCRKIDGERLDGLDNDCDGVIDNTGSGETPLTEAHALEIVSGLGDFSSLALASSRALTQVYVQKADGTLLSAPPEGGEPAAVSMMAQSDNSELTTALTSGCFYPSGTEAQMCDINQTATAAGSKLGYFAHVKALGCREGEIRVGAIDPEAPDEFIDRGPGFRNPSYQGVATYGSPCTENGRPACVDAKREYQDLVAQGASPAEVDEVRSAITTHCGASHPAIAASEDQALVAFLGAQVRENVCEIGSVDIFGLLLHERVGLRNGEFYFIDPSADGVPDQLGTSISAQPPALRAIGNLGFLMAHPETNGELTLTFIPRQDSPPGNGGVQCPDEGCESRADLETAPIVGATEFTTLPTSGTAEGIRMQWLSVNDSEGVLLVTWVRGCAPTDHLLENVPAYAQALRIDISGEEPEILWTGDAINLGNTRSFPLAVPSFQDFFVEGFERNEKAATSDDMNGFFVLTRPLGIQAVRVSAFDGALVSTDETIPVDPFADDPDSRPNTYRYLGAMGEDSPDVFYLRTTASSSLFRATFSSGK